MVHEGQNRNALKLLKYSIKNFFGFSPSSQLVKAQIEIGMPEQKSQFEPTVTGISYYITKERAQSLNALDDNPFSGKNDKFKNKKIGAQQDEMDISHVRHQDISANSILI